MAEYSVCIVMCAVGLLFAGVSWGAMRAGRSGVPFVGAIFIIIGSLLSPSKWLAFSALIIDPGFFMIVYCIIRSRQYNKMSVLIRNYCKNNDLAAFPAIGIQTLIISVDVINESLDKGYFSGMIFDYNVPRCYFTIVQDISGKMVLVLLPADEQIPRSIPFESDTLIVDELSYKGKPASLKLEIKRSEL
ncbi:MAG: hypothetical protein K6F91_05760 [Ruminococcus sp.]|nr:hypothetical protein [Ruminococcus sp.]